MNIKKNLAGRLAVTPSFAKLARRLMVVSLLALAFTLVANGQKPKCKKWSYDFSEVVKYFDTPLDACKSYVKEKYPNDNYPASVEAANDPEIFRCSAGETYIGVVYQRECESCCKKTARASQLRPHSPLRPLVFNSPAAGRADSAVLSFVER